MKQIASVQNTNQAIGKPNVRTPCYRMQVVRNSKIYYRKGKSKFNYQQRQNSWIV